jgi:hypothetical protein
MVEVLHKTLDLILDERLRNEAQRETVVRIIMEGFGSLEKKPVDNLEERTEKIEAGVRKMVESVKLGFVNERLEVRVVGSSGALLKQLRFGSDWFAPWPKVDQILLAAILVNPPK